MRPRSSRQEQDGAQPYSRHSARPPPPQEPGSGTLPASEPSTLHASLCARLGRVDHMYLRAGREPAGAVQERAGYTWHRLHAPLLSPPPATPPKSTSPPRPPQPLHGCRGRPPILALTRRRRQKRGAARRRHPSASAAPASLQVTSAPPLPAHRQTATCTRLCL